MPDYKKGKIYTIRCFNDTSLVYVGSTTQTLSQRWTDHKKNCSVEKYQNVCLYKKMNELGKDNFYIELYDEYPSEDKNQLEKKEGEIARQIGTLNQRIAGRNHEEYLKEEKEKVKQSQQKYRNKNQEEFKKYQSKYQNENKESILQNRKQYREKK